ncbi:MAG: helix-turn-helix domain-containing protein [Rhizobiales bacterium]|nr:helix-turn-helix domain-containing protein [Hyphomicrobiales bacterium]
MTVKSAQRVVDIFELFAVQKKPVALSALASALRLPKSSCLALLKTLPARATSTR